MIRLFCMVMVPSLNFHCNDRLFSNQLGCMAHHEQLAMCIMPRVGITQSDLYAIHGITLLLFHVVSRFNAIPNTLDCFGGFLLIAPYSRILSSSFGFHLGFHNVKSLLDANPASLLLFHAPQNHVIMHTWCLPLIAMGTVSARTEPLSHGLTVYWFFNYLIVLMLGNNTRYHFLHPKP